MIFAGLGDLPACEEDNCLFLYGAPCNTCRMPDGTIVSGVNAAPTPSNPPPGVPVQTPSSTPGVLLPGGINCLDSNNASNPACKALCSNPLYASYPACQPWWKKTGFIALGIVSAAAIGAGVYYHRRKRS